MVLALVSEHSKGRCKCIRVLDLFLCKVSGREASVCCHMHISASSDQAPQTGRMPELRCPMCGCIPSVISGINIGARADQDLKGSRVPLPCCKYSRGSCQGRLSIDCCRNQLHH